jgi:hypothetical protein
MAYTDLTSEFAYRDPWFWQRHDALAENDAANLGAFALSRRPVLKYINATTIDVENNTGLANQTRIVFPDNQVRMVAENTSVTSAYRRFTINTVASFTTGTEESGLRSGLSEASSWYAIYAVKSLINSANFVLVGDSTLPIQANYSTLDAAYGANSWVYLGLFLNGSPSTYTPGPDPGDIFPFVQCGSLTLFTGMDITPGNLIGTGMAVGNNYTPTLGVTPRTRMPNNIAIAIYAVYMYDNGAGVNDATEGYVRDVGNNYYMRKLKINLSTSSRAFLTIVRTNATDGIHINTNYSSGGTDTFLINLYGWRDGALGSPGMNSFI